MAQILVGLALALAGFTLCAMSLASQSYEGLTIGVPVIVGSLWVAYHGWVRRQPERAARHVARPLLLDRLGLERWVPLMTGILIGLGSIVMAWTEFSGGPRHYTGRGAALWNALASIGELTIPLLWVLVGVAAFVAGAFRSCGRRR